MNNILLTRVHLSRFRGFEDLHVRFQSQFSAIVGVNGSGKSTILEAIACILGATLERLGVGNPRPFGLDDGHFGLPEVVQVQAKLDFGNEIDLSLVRRDDGSTRANWGQGEPAEVSWEQLPLFAHYRTGRLYYGSPAALDIEPRLSAYEDCLDPSTNRIGLSRWLKSEFGRPAGGERKTSVAIINAVSHCLPGELSLGYDSRLGPVLRPPEPAPALALRLAADGIRGIVSLVADMAWRAAVLNPQLGEKCVELVQGIVLIDEIDLHLHPLWQRQLVSRIQTCFPNLQIVVTTHSPFVVKEVEAGGIINLDGQSEDPSGSLEDVAELVFGVQLPQQSLRQMRLALAANHFYSLLAEVGSEEDLVALRSELDAALAPFARHPAALALFELELLAAADAE